jgi:hypothetical protein
MYLGPGPILANVGGDATIPFEMAHGEDAYKFLMVKTLTNFWLHSK